MDYDDRGLGPYEPVPDELVLAAVARAVRHGPETIWIVHVGYHLGFRKSGRTTRNLREQLERMRIQSGWVVSRELCGREYWQLTPAGERQLSDFRQAGQVGELPESPQHRTWRRARAVGRERIDAFRALLSAAIQDAHTAELNLDSPSSPTWMELGKRLAAAAWLVASATYCAEEWAEPSDDSIDLDTSDPAHGSTPPRRAVGRWDEMEAIAKGTHP